MIIQQHVSVSRTRSTALDLGFVDAVRSLFADGTGVKRLHEYGLHVTVVSTSNKARDLFDLLRAYDITPVSLHNLRERERGLVALVNHELVFPPSSNDLYFLAHHLGGLTDTFDDPPWFVRDDTCFASEHALRLFHRVIQREHVFPQHAQDRFKDLPLLMTTKMKQRLEAQNLIGFSAVPAQPISHRNLVGTDEPAEFEVIMHGRAQAQFSDLKPVAPTSETDYWWALVPPLVMPALHPLFVRYDARLRFENAVPITDPHYKATLCFLSPSDLNIPPIYTPEAMATTPPFDFARMAEHQTPGDFNGRLIVSERGKVALSEFLKEPEWKRVGILPADAKLPEV